MWRDFKGLSTGVKAVILSTLVGVIGTIGIAANDPSMRNASQVQDEPPVSQVEPKESTPKVEKKTVTETSEVPFSSSTTPDPSLNKGETAIRTAGVKGIKTLTYELTLSDGVETAKKLIKEEVTTPPINEVIAIGTKVAETSNCHPNYSGCVPIASDVDCAGGSGNGPAYVSGPVQVIGADIYRLDADRDGIGCE